MLLIVALLLAASFSFAAEWVDVAVKPKLVESSGDSYYEISSAKELAWFSKEVASGKTGINAVLKNDIVLWNPASGDTNYWNPIGPSDSLAFEGTFDGDGKTIAGAHSVYEERNLDTLVNGFFRYVGESGVVKNLTLKQSFIKTVYAGSDTITDTSAEDAVAPQLYSTVGGIAGYNKGLLQNVSFVGDSVVAAGDSKVTSGARTGNIYIVNYIAGNIAAINDGVIDGFESDAQLNVRNRGIMSLSFNIGYAGGAVGINRGSVKNGVNLKYVNLPNIGFAGGICGYNYGSIENVENRGIVYNNEGSAGGIASYNLGTIKRAVMTTSIRGSASYTTYGGGVTAYNNGYITESGMFQTKNSNITVNKNAQEYQMMGVSILPAEGTAGGVSATQGPQGVIENCGAAVWIVGVGVSSTTKSRNIYVGGLVGLDSGSVIGSYAANSNLLQGDKYKPMYYIVDSTKKHSSNHYDSTYLSVKFDDENAGLPTSTMRSAKYAWLLNTQMGSAKNNGVWTYDDWYPLIANMDKIPTYRVVRYVNDAAYDTLYTNYLGHAIWNDRIPEGDNGKSLAYWAYRNGDSFAKITDQHIFKSDTSIYAVLDAKENLDFTVTFLDYNGVVLQELKNIPYGTVPQYSGPELFRDSTGLMRRYTFKGWSPAVTEVHYNQVYKALYDSTYRKYQVSYSAVCLNRDYSRQDTSIYGNEAHLCGRYYPGSCTDSLNEYVFKGWNVNCDSFAVLSDTTIYAVYDTIPLSSSSSEKISSSSSVEEKSSSSKTEAIQLPLASVSLKYSVERGWVHVYGLTAGVPVTLFDVQGNLVKREISTGSNLSIALERRGMYILRYMGTSYRVFVP